MELLTLNPHAVMQECARLALMGKGYTKTNPVVGSVLANSSEILSGGWHEIFGGAHAEVNAINNCPVSTKGLDMYVTLEPCSHHGKTPPCVERIVEAGIKRVFVGVVDPNPVNAGKGIKYLRDHGVEVLVGYEEDICASIIEDFAKYIYTGKPYYTLKTAQSLDGKTAASGGDSKWITGNASRTYAHYMRAASDAVLVGVGTVIADDPELNVRLMKSDRDPYKIVIDPDARMPLDRKLVEDSVDKLIYVTRCETEKSSKLKMLGADIVYVQGNGRLDLHHLSLELAKRDILNVMIEGGADTAGGFFDAGLIDRVNCFIAPVMLGGTHSCISGTGVETVADGYRLKDMQVQHFENDILIAGNLTDYRTPVLELTAEIQALSCTCGQE